MNSTKLVALAAAIAVAGLASVPPADASASHHCLGMRATIVSAARHVEGTAGPDVILATAPKAEVRAGDGADRICTGNGADAVYGDAGADRIDVGNGENFASGGTGHDRIKAGDDLDRLNGDAGPDRVFGGDGGDTIQGQAGDDKLFGSANPVISPDRVDGGLGADAVHGGLGGDVLNDGPGRDYVGGDYGADVLTPSRDRLPDEFSGGADIDRVDYQARGRFFGLGVTVSLDGIANDGIGCAAACEGDNVDPDFENIVGGQDADVLLGDAGPNAIAGAGGDDTLRGGAGDDSLDGGVDDDGCYGDDGLDAAVACEFTFGVP